ncbi:MAG: hypothetical protein JXA33_17600 [Anaerolineae bacterium]|nr:hypothetical protein [Anaerolineae bacterium]
MTILKQLSSQSGNRNANREVASQCLENKSLIQEIISGLKSNDNKIVVDCTEVFTEIAKEQPTWIAPYGHLLPEILDNKNNRARWEAMHCLALIAEYTPSVIEPIIHQLIVIIEEDESVIVRDYAIDAVGNYAKTSEKAAQAAYPILERATRIWEGRHAKQALNGLCNVVTILPEKKESIRVIVNENLDHEKGTARKSAKKLLRLIEKK